MRIVDILEFCHGRSNQYLGEPNNHWTLIAELVEELADAASDEIKQTYRFVGYERWKNERYGNLLSTSRREPETLSEPSSEVDLSTFEREIEDVQKRING